MTPEDMQRIRAGNGWREHLLAILQLAAGLMLAAAIHDDNPAGCNSATARR